MAGLLKGPWEKFVSPLSLSHGFVQIRDMYDHSETYNIHD